MKKILLIDDEPDFTEIVSTLLRFHDLEVDAVNDPRLVESRLKGIQYGLVVTDLMMPGLDGFELVRRLREMPSYQAAPVIVISAKTLSDAERKLLLQNNVVFMMKPFEPQGLVDKVTELLKSATDL